MMMIIDQFHILFLSLSIFFRSIFVSNISIDSNDDFIIIIVYCLYYWIFFLHTKHSMNLNMVVAYYHACCLQIRWLIIKCYWMKMMSEWVINEWYTPWINWFRLFFIHSFINNNNKWYIHFGRHTHTHKHREKRSISNETFPFYINKHRHLIRIWIRACHYHHHCVYVHDLWH